jgi:hypothetical protein
VKECVIEIRWNRKWLEANIQSVLGGAVETKSRRGESSQVLNLKKEEDCNRVG